MKGYVEMEQQQSEYRNRLKQAVSSEQPPPYLEARVRARLSEVRRPRPLFWRFAPAGLAAALCGIALLGYLAVGPRYRKLEQSRYIARVTSAVSSLIRVGLGDHIHCAVFGEYPASPPPAEQFVAELGPKYRDLIELAHDKVPSNYKLYEAHQCRFEGRRFVHLTMKDRDRFLSLIITKKSAEESLAASNLVPALKQAGITFYQSSADKYQIAAFETQGHLAYIVSDLSGTKNTEIMVALAPGIEGVLKHSEL